MFAKEGWNVTSRKREILVSISLLISVSPVAFGPIETLLLESVELNLFCDLVVNLNATNSVVHGKR